MDSWFLQARKLLRPFEPRRITARFEADSTLDQLVSADPTGEVTSTLDARFGLVVRLGRAFLSFGLPAQRLEEALARIAQALDLEIDCFSTPTAMIATLSDGSARRTRVVRVEPGDTDLERLSALHALVGRIERKELSPSDASRRIDGIIARPQRYGETTLNIACGLVSAAASILLGGGPGDVFPALILGILVGLLVRVAKRAPTFGRIVPALAALLSTVLARVMGLAGAPVNEPILVLAAVLVLLPGFTLTVATLELATAHVVSGTSRLVGGLSTLIQLAFGVLLGHRLAEFLPALAAQPPAESPEWLLLAAHTLAALAFTLLLKAAPRDFLPILVGAAISVAGMRLGRVWLGPELGAFIGALFIGVAAHVFARLRDRPVLLLLTPGMLMLVPGSLGFLSVSLMVVADTVSALETGFRMLLIATSLAAGLLVATLAIPPRRAL